MELQVRRINLENAVNMRDLGGYMRPDGKVTKFGQFLRSGNPSRLTEKEIEFLQNFGLKTVIDLRSDKEVDKEKSAFSEISGINYFHIPMFDGGMKGFSNSFDNLGDLYAHTFEHATSYPAIFDTMAKNAEGTILFNCTAGKDRTGMTAAILLLLAGVDSYDIVADYQVSFTYFSKIFAQTKEVHPDMPMHFAYSQPEWIENFINLIENEGGIESFLKKKGVAAESIEILKNKLI
ncbi:tyrosine-protein phosphatase [Tyzzerella sp. OttesenSCG-928-J15]|nr:tyrosine-protein phosphatase [Tyzzerella sp. OttesenSCG-928-J15]